jgi:hypothetical protein
MPRKPSPFLVGDCWYSDAGGKRTLRARGRKNRKQAEEALAELLARRNRAERRPPGSVMVGAGLVGLQQGLLDYVRGIDLAAQLLA